MGYDPEIVERAVELYKQQKSIDEIILVFNEEYPEGNWYPMKISRILKKGRKEGLMKCMRNSQTAAKVAVRKGRLKCPTKGRERTPEEKENISQGISKFLDEMTEEEREAYRKAIADAQHKRWENMSEKEKSELAKKMKDGINNRIQTGISHIQKAIHEELKDRGLGSVLCYKLDAYTNLEIDICIMDKKLGSFAIEVDGITHYKPVYGEDTLKGIQESDKRKNAKLVGEGYKVLRLKTEGENTSRRIVRRVCNYIENWMSDKNSDKLTYAIIKEIAEDASQEND